jgi:hypothetical protein
MDTSMTLKPPTYPGMPWKPKNLLTTVTECHAAQAPSVPETPGSPSAAISDASSETHGR